MVMDTELASYLNETGKTLTQVPKHHTTGEGNQIELK
jgi:hypothetical protein